jgi:cytochrome b involved in lipid metabolism
VLQRTQPFYRAPYTDVPLSRPPVVAVHSGACTAHRFVLLAFLLLVAAKLAAAAAAALPAAPEMTRAAVAAAAPAKALFIIHNEVYDVTKFMDEHPGGPSVISEYIGRDATGAFEGTGHSAGARRQLAGLRVATIAAAERVEGGGEGGKDGKCAVM